MLKVLELLLALHPYFLLSFLNTYFFPYFFLYHLKGDLKSVKQMPS